MYEINIKGIDLDFDETSQRKFRFSNKIRINLTELGVKYMEDWYDKKLRSLLTNPDLQTLGMNNRKIPKVDEEGWCEMRIVDVFTIFSQFIYDSDSYDMVFKEKFFMI